MYKAIKRINCNEAHYKFLIFPAQYVRETGIIKDKILVEINGEKVLLNFNLNMKKLYGLSKWFKKYDIQVGDKVIFEKKPKIHLITLEKE